MKITRSLRTLEKTLSLRTQKKTLLLGTLQRNLPLRVLKRILSLRTLKRTLSLINVKGSPISNEKMIKLLGVTVDNKLSFEPHLNLVCKKVSQKLHGLARVSKFISKKKLKVVMKAFKMS